MSIFINILLVIEVFISLLIILLVLMQRPKNEGLGAAFGGGVTENLFGHETTTVLQKLTRNLGIAFFGLTLLLSWLYVKQSSSKSRLLDELAKSKSPAAATAPAPGAKALDLGNLGADLPKEVESPALKLDAATPAPQPGLAPDGKPASESLPLPPPIPDTGEKKENAPPAAPGTPAAAPVVPPADPNAAKPEAPKPVELKPAEPKPSEATPKPPEPAPAKSGQ